MFANLYAVQPLLPLLVTEFAVSELEAAKSLTLATLMLGLSLLVYGPISDAVGRKVIMLGSLCGTTLITFALSYAESFEQLLWLRALHGFLLGGIPATAVAYIGEEFPKTKVAAIIGFYISANSLGGISGRVLGGVISDFWDWHTVFTVLTLCNFSTLLFCIVILPASTHFTPQSLRPQAIARGLLSHMGNLKLFAAYLVGGVNFMIFLTLYSYVIFVLADEPFALSSSWLGLLFLTYLSGSIASAFTGSIANYLSCTERIICGTGLIIIGTLITLHGSLAGIIGGLLVNAFGFFLAHSSLTTWVNRQAVGSKASASSLYLVFYYLGASSGTLYLNPFWQWAGFQGVVMGAISLMVLSLGACLWLRSQEFTSTEIHKKFT